MGETELSSEQKRRWDEAADYYRKLYKTCDDLLKETPVGAVTVIDEANPENNKNNIEVGEDLEGLKLIKEHNSSK